MPIYILWNYEKGGKKHAGKHETADEGYAVYPGKGGSNPGFQDKEAGNRGDCPAP